MGKKIRVLWVTNTLLPEASNLLEQPVFPYGGWLVNASKKLALLPEIELIIATPKNDINSTMKLEGEHINYYLFPWKHGATNPNLNYQFELKSLIETLNPDVIHMYGTEFDHSNTVVKICRDLNLDQRLLISIQGLSSLIAEHYLSGIPFHVAYGSTMRDLIRRDNIMQQKHKFEKRGELEIETIRLASNVEGRTTWDRAYIQQINSDARYFYCPRILRESFYIHQWKLETCQRYSIFVTQAAYTIKGLHFLLDALKTIKIKYPDVMLYLAGDDIVSSNTFNSAIRRSYYGKFLNRKIEKYGLKNHITFLGQLNEAEMMARFLKSHVFVSASSVENESNSLIEAMLLGVPSVASYVGGIPDTMQDKVDGFLYQHDAPYMLAYFIDQIFDNDQVAKQFSKNAREKALKKYDPQVITQLLLNIYKEIIN